jgi:2-polyprenyl-3-methyl-5-hydroxy-6-metoxy-1,4-benzoquinol methylase
MFSHRSSQSELMDGPDVQPADLHRTLAELDTINHLLGGNAVTLNALDKIFTKELIEAHPKRIWRIADLGSGGGGMLRAISEWAAKRKIAVHLTGIDLNPVMTAYAREKSKQYININYRQADVLSDEFEKLQYDVVTSSLFCHHFTNQDLITLFARLREQVTLAVIVNDIHRHPLAYYSIKWLTALFSKSYLVKNDAGVSVLRAFTKNELRDVIKQSGAKKFTVKWKWAFRWQAIIFSGKILPKSHNQAANAAV